MDTLFFRSLFISIAPWLGSFLTAFSVAVEAGEFTLYTYHDKPPYFESTHSGYKGIYKEFVDYLNNQQSDITVVLSFQPRKRLEDSLHKNKLDGGVLGVNPLWFNDSEKAKYLWSNAFMLDQDVVVTQKTKVFDYKHPKDLIGKRLALPRGLYFWGVSELIVDGKIRVYETSSDLQDLEMVLLDRADATITSQLTFRYFTHNRFSPEQFSVFDTPHDKFERYVLFPRQYNSAYKRLAPVISNAINDPEWLAVLHRYHYAQ